VVSIAYGIAFAQADAGLEGLTLFCGSSSLLAQKNSLFLKNNSLVG
jgi:hypothetical protein